ncbi:hypothetical protein COOONC_11170, partial [Cooperia oncophora]
LVDGLFFPFKTPLCSLYDDQIEKKLRFHPEDVFNHPAVKGKKIGLWIDLTKTDRYYFVKEAPNKPSWEYGDAVGYDGDNEASTSVAHSQENIENMENGEDKPQGKQFMDGLVRGVVLVTDPLKKKMLQGKIKELVGAKRDGFPGLQPVSLERSRDNDNLKMLAQRPYMVSWKADGMRYMIYICDENEVYAFDRDNEVRVFFDFLRLMVPSVLPYYVTLSFYFF